ncbi:hypothetical protein ACIBHX_00550 [Nonomuraea sp. NPDC050536]|uniref:hypothetical protein n=1 Tax=Nonomuraea sp. NPDC050536 TaxID=3364366 RepID=UPI0037C74E26
MITGVLELSPEGKAMKFYELVPFTLHITVDTVLDALRADEAAGKEGPDNVQESR